MPKNEVLRFKGVSDDLYESMAHQPMRLAVLRLFGVAGDARPELRRYAARHGIALVERSRWPAPVLADDKLVWPGDTGPSEGDRRRLAWLCRPMQRTLVPQPDGSLLLVPPPRWAAVDALLALQDRWSARLWAALDGTPGLYDRYRERLVAA